MKASRSSAFTLQLERNRMKVVGFNGSPRKDGNTGILIHKVFRELEKEGIETELVQLSTRNPWVHRSYKCAENKDRRCFVTMTPQRVY